MLSDRLTLGAMKLLRHIITIICLVGTADAGDQLTTKAKSVLNQSTNAEQQRLQGTWEGAVAGDKAHETITITIAGNSLHFHRDTNFWFDTTITLPAGTDPKQFHATIKGCPPAQADSIGKVVGAIFRIENGTLTLADYAISDEPPKTFADAKSRYVLKKVQPQRENAEPPKIK